MNSTDQTQIAQRSGRQIYFAHRDMDYYLSWIMGRAGYDGSDPSECIRAAERIRNGDPRSWQRVWADLAEHTEQLARQYRDQGEHVTARRAFLRACSYYRAPLFLMAPSDAAFVEYWERMRVCFREAAGLSDPPILPISVPFGAARLPGYLWTPPGPAERRPTLVVVGGVETFAEDCYFMIGSAGAERGYTVLTVDLPGQGMNPRHGLVFEARMGRAVQAVLQYAIGRPQVDPRSVALYGFSWGGHIAMHGAQHNQRPYQLPNALIVNPAMPDVFRAAWAQQANHARDHVSRLVIEQIAWRMGLRLSVDPQSIVRRLAKAYDYLTHGAVDPGRITCPTLCLAGAGEAPITLTIARECLRKLPDPRSQLVVFTAEQGSDAHCQVDNLALPNRTIFDWLDTIFPPTTSHAS